MPWIFQCCLALTEALLYRWITNIVYLSYNVSFSLYWYIHGVTYQFYQITDTVHSTYNISFTQSLKLLFQCTIFNFAKLRSLYTVHLVYNNIVLHKYEQTYCIFNARSQLIISVIWILNNAYSSCDFQFQLNTNIV